LTSFEIDHQEQSWLKRVSNNGYHHRGEGHEQVAKAEAALDTAFIDADKSGYGII